MPEDFKIGFLKALGLLKPYLSEVVIGGGWVPLIYYHYLLGKTEVEPIRTKDIDLFVPERVPLIGAQTIDQLLLQAGFKVVFKSHDTPPAITYEGDIDGYEVEIEFLTHQRGPKDDVAIEVQNGLKAQALRFASISIDNAIEVEIDDFLRESGLLALKVKVPSPGAYIFHKGLVFPRRREEQKKAKDLYYIFDILANCPELRQRIINELKEQKQSHPSWFRTFEKNLRTHFSSITSDGVNLVASQRLANSYPHLNSDQFKRYSFEVFQDFMEEVSSI